MLGVAAILDSADHAGSEEGGLDPSAAGGGGRRHGRRGVPTLMAPRENAPRRGSSISKTHKRCAPLPEKYLSCGRRPFALTPLLRANRHVGAAGGRARGIAPRRVPPPTRRDALEDPATHVHLPSPHGPSGRDDLQTARRTRRATPKLTNIPPIPRTRTRRAGAPDAGAVSHDDPG